jgi:hypothetical protein
MAYASFFNADCSMGGSPAPPERKHSGIPLLLRWSVVDESSTQRDAILWGPTRIDEGGLQRLAANRYFAATTDDQPWGIWSQVCPRSSRPAFFLFRPPHCLKKNGTSARRHCWRMSSTQAGSIGRGLRPDSPPTITTIGSDDCR